MVSGHSKDSFLNPLMDSINWNKLNIVQTLRKFSIKPDSVILFHRKSLIKKVI